jgi:uncharacterized oligopeptide transporter (OPT) family protein
MTEAEIVQAYLGAGQIIIGLFSMFLTMVSAYIAGLYLFLNRAPLALRVLTFALLSIGLVFLGAAAAIQQLLQHGLVAAWVKLPSPVFSIAALNNPLAVPLLGGWSLYDVGPLLGWIAAASVYVTLGYMTFVYRWKE